MTSITIAKAVGGPGSIGFLVVGTLLGFAIARLWPRGRGVGPGFAWLAALYVGYILLALPLIAQSIASPFAGTLAGQQRVDGRLDTLIVFDGDNRRGRLRESMRLWAVAKPTTIIVSGERWLLEHLVQSGIPRDRILRDRESGTTREQIGYVDTYMRRHQGQGVAVVASRLQVPRIAALFQQAGLRVPVYAAPVDKELTDQGVWRYVPTYAALRISRDSLYERAALVYYRWKGWIGGPNSSSLS